MERLLKILIWYILVLTPWTLTGCAEEPLNGTLGQNASSVHGEDGELSITIPKGYYDGTQQCLAQDSDLTPANIKSGVNLFGVIGIHGGSFASAMSSQALRSPGVIVIPQLSNQVTSQSIRLASETSTYAGTDLPSTSSLEYRDIPDMALDGDGVRGLNCRYAPRPQNDCGLSQSTIQARIEDCASQNPSSSLWDGEVECSRGQGAWKLVTRDGANKEVWQDQRTGLLWSSQVGQSINWCQASGNTQEMPLIFRRAYNGTTSTPIVGSGTLQDLQGGSSSVSETITVTFSDATNFTVSSSGSACDAGAISAGGLTTTAGSTVTWSRAGYCEFTIVQGSTNFAANDTFLFETFTSTRSCAPGAASGNQPASPVSYCAEAAGLNPGTGETWTSSGYFAAKGGMGRNSTPAVSWRLPTIEDFQLANVNGIRFVMPDMGTGGNNRLVPDGSTGFNGSEWSATVDSYDRRGSWSFDGDNGYMTPNNHNSTLDVRCVGR